MAKTKEEKKVEPELKATEFVENEQEVQPTQEEQLKKEIDELNDKYLRLVAEYDNFRKRSQKERESIYSEVKATVIFEFLPVLDNFDRANEITDTTSHEYKKGMDMTYSQLIKIIEKLGVESFGEPNEKFDPNIHNAVMHSQDESFEENVITEVFSKGYRMGEKILRPAMVKVVN